MNRSTQLRTVMSGVFRPEHFGPIDGSNDATYIQAAIDAAEGGGTVYFNASTIYRIKKTLYIGNVNLRAVYGTTINWRIDDDGTNFVKVGAGALKAVGAILCKSGQSAGYGLSTVAITSDALSIDFNKSTGGVVFGPLLLENTSAFVCPTITVDADNTSTDSCNSLDFYQGVQGVTIGTVNIDLDNGGPTVQGGFWIRNKSLARDTKTIDIANLNITHKGIDEAFAIFNDTNNGDLNNIHLGQVVVNLVAGAHGLGGSIYEAGTYSAAKYANILIDNLTFNVAGFTASAPFVWKTSGCAPTITHLTINHTAGDAGSLGTNAWMVRHTIGSGQTARPHYGQVDITCSANVSVSSAAYVIDGGGVGGIDIDTLNVSGAATGWTNTLKNVGIIGAGNISLVPTALQIDGCESFIGTASGKFGIRDCLSFVGTLGLDTAVFTGVACFIQSTAVPVTNIVFDATINLTGVAAALARVFLAQANGGVLTTVPCKVRYSLVNPLNLAITSNDSDANKCFFNAYDATMNVNGTITRRNNGGTKTLATDTISTTISQASGAVETQSGAAADDFSTLSGATIDTQIQVLWMANAAHVVTAKHNVGNLNLTGAADVVMSASPATLSNVLGLRWNAGTSKWDQVANGGW